jgi:hypothetical protein
MNQALYAHMNNKRKMKKKNLLEQINPATQCHKLIGKVLSICLFVLYFE